MPHRLAILAAAVTALAVPTAAQADTLALSLPPSPILFNSPLTITVTGSSSPNEFLKVFTESSETIDSPATCPQGHGYYFGEAEPASLPQTLHYEAPHSPGYYRACAYLLTEHVDAEDSVDASAEVHFTVVDFAEREAEEKSQREAREVEALRAAEHRALSEPASILGVRLIPRPKRRETEIAIRTNPFATTTVTLRRGKWKHVETFNPGTPSLTATETSGTVAVSWSCKRAIYRYTVAARTDVGAALTRSGHFTTGAYCR